jgi:hypothetical protein
MKNSSDTIGNRTRNLPACTAVSQPSAPPRVPLHIVVMLNYDHLKNVYIYLRALATGSPTERRRSALFSIMIATLTEFCISWHMNTLSIKLSLDALRYQIMAHCNKQQICDT